MKYKKFNIISLSDDGYAQQLCVTIYSTIKNFSKKDELGFYVLDNGISDINKQKIVDSCKSFNVPITFLKTDCSEFKKYTSGKFNESTFARLYIERLFPGLDKILYIDSDTVVNGDLAKLFDIDIKNYSAGVVRAEFDFSDEELMTRFKHIGVGNPMFGAGVMIINIKWRVENRVLEKTYEYLGKNHQNLIYFDQDVLNHLLHDSILFIPPKYNATNTILYSHFYQEMSYEKNEYLEAKKHPVVIHFAGGCKPWNGDCFHKGNRIWRENLKQTTYKSWRLPIRKYFTTNRYKFLIGKIISDFVSLFGYAVYSKFLCFWRKFVL